MEGFRGLSRGAPDMNSLVALGAAASFGASVVAASLPALGEPAPQGWLGRVGRGSMVPACLAPLQRTRRAPGSNGVATLPCPALPCPALPCPALPILCDPVPGAGPARRVAHLL